MTNHHERRAAKARKAKTMPDTEGLDLADRAEPRWLGATILVPDPRKLDDVVTTLYEHDFEVEVLDWIAPDDPARWLRVRVLSYRGDDAFLLWTMTVVEPAGGLLTEEAEGA